MSREVQYNYVLTHCSDSDRILTLFIISKKTMLKKAKYLAVETYNGKIVSTITGKLSEIIRLYSGYNITSDVQNHFDDMDYRIRYGELSDRTKEQMDDLPVILEITNRLNDCNDELSYIKEKYETLKETCNALYGKYAKMSSILKNELLEKENSSILVTSLYDKFIHEIGLSSEIFNEYLILVYLGEIEYINGTTPYKLLGYTLKDEDPLNEDDTKQEESIDNSDLNETNCDTVISKNVHNHDPISAFYRKYIKIKKGSKSSLEIIYKYFQNQYSDISYNEFVDGLKRIETIHDEIQVDGDYLIGGIYSKSNSFEKNENFTPIQRNMSKRSVTKSQNEIEDITNENHVNDIIELYKTISTNDIQSIHYPQYSIEQIRKITSKSNIRKMRNNSESVEVLKSFNGEKTIKELAKLTGLTEGNIRNKVRLHNIPYKKVKKGNPNFSKISSESSKSKSDSTGTDIIIKRFIENHFITTNNIQDSIRITEVKELYKKHCEKLEVIPNENKFIIAMREKFKPNTKFTAYVFIKYIN